MAYKPTGRPVGRPRKPRNEAAVRAGIMRRGNYTHGPERRGNKDGRPALYPADTTTWRLSLSLSDREFAIAILAGNGNAGQGARRALRTFVLDERDAQAPLTRYEADNFVRLRKARGKADPRFTGDPEDAPQVPEPPETASPYWDDLSTTGDDNDD